MEWLCLSVVILSWFWNEHHLWPSRACWHISSLHHHWLWLLPLDHFSFSHDAVVLTVVNGLDSKKFFVSEEHWYVRGSLNVLEKKMASSFWWSQMGAVLLPSWRGYPEIFLDYVMHGGQAHTLLLCQPSDNPGWIAPNLFPDPLGPLLYEDDHFLDGLMSHLSPDVSPVSW